MRSLRFLLVLLAATAAARAAAPVITNIANFPSVSVSYTNYLAEGVVTNGFTLGGVRKTAWPSGGLPGTVIASGTPSVGDLLSASDTSGTNGVWSTPLWSTNSGSPQLTGYQVYFTNGWFKIGGPSTYHFQEILVDNRIVSTDSDRDTAFYVEQTDTNIAHGDIQTVFFVARALHSTGSYSFVQAMSVDANNDDNGDVDYLNAFSMSPVQRGSGNTTEMVGANIAMGLANGSSGHVGTAYGYRLSSPTGATNIGTVYGLYMADITGATNGNYAIKTGLGAVDLGDLTTGRKGFASLATDSLVAISSGGWTNSFGKNAVVRFDGTAVTYVVYNNAGTAQYTNSTAVGHATELLQPNGKILITAGSGVSGTASPF